MLDKELKKCQTKGEYINYILKNSKEIKDIDSAIPIETQMELTLLGVEGFFATVYYSEANDYVIRISDVISLATLVSKKEL